MKLRFSIFLTVVTFLTGCATVYHPLSNDEPTAQIFIGKLFQARMCVDGKWYRLKKDSLGNALIPAGKRISLINKFFEEDSNAYRDVLFSCQSGLSFIPEPAKSYYANFDIVGEECVLEVFLQDQARVTGLRMEPSVGPEECS